MIHSEIIFHKKQQRNYSCGAACFAMLFGIEESMARKAVKTKSSGTNQWNVVRAIESAGLTAHDVNINKAYLEIKDFLNSMSFHFPIYATCTYRTRARGKKGGRDEVREHAILLADGMVYDPSERAECPIDSYEHTFGKSLMFRSIIIVDEERPSFGRKDALTRS